MTQRAILFDFWQTLFIDTKERETLALRKKLIANRLVALGHGYPTRLDEAFDAIRPWVFSTYYNDQRTPDSRERLLKVFDHCGIEMPQEHLHKLVFDFEEMGIHLEPAMTPNAADVISELGRDYPLGIVSDTGYTPGRVLRRYLEKHGLLRYFRAFSFSNETGHAKPHRNTFLHALGQIGANPADAIHCGDLPSHDIKGAGALGITTVLYTGHHHEESDGIVSDFVISDWQQLPEIVHKVFD